MTLIRVILAMTAVTAPVVQRATSAAAAPRVVTNLSVTTVRVASLMNDLDERGEVMGSLEMPRQIQLTRQQLGGGGTANQCFMARFHQLDRLDVSTIGLDHSFSAPHV
jgi:hypothetical protein